MSQTDANTNTPEKPGTAIEAMKAPMVRLLHMETISGIALIAGAVIAVALATSPAAETMDHFWHNHLAVSIGTISIDESLQHWINDALMTIFFLVAGLEIKRELIHGDLRSPRKAALPIAAAFGGMVVPALLFVVMTQGTDASAGWGVPMATDIAFAVGVLTLLGDRVPSKLKILLLTLAIVDDLGAILVIAIFYSASINTTYLGLAALGLAAIVLLKQLGVWWMPIYVLIGAGVWLATFESGVHATLAGVACGLLAPASPRRPNPTLVEARPESTVDELKEIIFDTRETRSVADRLIHQLHPWTALLIVPLFAMANAGVSVAPGVVTEAASSTVFQAIIVGLVIGKPLGIVGAAYLAVKSGLASLPDGIGWRHVTGLGLLGGIGFTVSIFIGGLAFESALMIDEAKIGILVASVLASVLGAAAIVSGGSVAAASALTANDAVNPSPTPNELSTAHPVSGPASLEEALGGIDDIKTTSPVDEKVRRTARTTAHENRTAGR